MDSKQAKLYDELADWWQVVLPTSDYTDEGAFFNKLLKDASVIKDSSTAAEEFELTEVFLGIKKVITERGSSNAD